MEDLNVVDSINGAGTWLVRNQELLLSYAVNIVAAIAIIIIGMIDRHWRCRQPQYRVAKNRRI